MADNNANLRETGGSWRTLADDASDLLAYLGGPVTTNTHGVDWQLVAKAIQTRMDELFINQTQLRDLAKVSPITLRELVRADSDSYRRQTLVKVGVALGWGPDGIVRVGRGEDPGKVEADVSVEGDYDIVELLVSVHERLGSLGDVDAKLSDVAVKLDDVAGRLDRLERTVGG